MSKQKYMLVMTVTGILISNANNEILISGSAAEVWKHGAVDCKCSELGWRFVYP